MEGTSAPKILEGLEYFGPLRLQRVSRFVLCSCSKRPADRKFVLEPNTKDGPVSGVLT